jgi:hypothetical protein
MKLDFDISCAKLSSQCMFKQMNFMAYKLYTNKSILVFKFFIYLLLIFGSTGVWIQGLALARQALCHLSHAPNPIKVLKKIIKTIEKSQYSNS